MKKIIFLTIFFVFNSFASENFDLYKLESNKKGPTLLVFAGIHGNEPGGYFAASILATHYKITQGNLWLVPNTNKESIRRYKRGLNGDLNRKFAVMSKKDKDKEVIKKIKELIVSDNIDLVLNLHDGHGFFRQKYQNTIFNPGAWGQTCVIDQIKLDHNNSFGNLDCIAQKVSNALNQHLLQDHHSFNVRNTNTKKKKNEMLHSLTYFSINNDKPAFAIETSKELKTTAQKVYYQLRAIEAFMQIMGIKYKRDFELDSQNVASITKSNGHITINGHILLNLDGLRKNLRYFPLQSSKNLLYFTHPLGIAKEYDNFIDLYVGHKKVSRLHKSQFTLGKSDETFEFIIDGNKKSVRLPSEVRIIDDIVINAPRGFRVNIIGFTDPRYKNEMGIKITKSSLIKRFAINKKQTKFRAEFYKNNVFYGMAILNYVARKKK